MSCVTLQPTLELLSCIAILDRVLSTQGAQVKLVVLLGRHNFASTPTDRTGGPTSLRDPPPSHPNVRCLTWTRWMSPLSCFLSQSVMTVSAEVGSLARH